jgi:drug/metabolite transporter (DMT)-like permease
MKIEVLRLIIVVVSALMLTVADAVIKTQSGHPGFMSTVFGRWMGVAYLLYFLQVVLGFWLFRTGAVFTVYVNMFVLTYGIACLLVGVWLFKEVLNPLQWAGIGLGFLAAMLMNAK